MAKYEHNFPSIHFTYDEFEEFVELLAAGMDFDDPYSGIKISVTRGGLTKEYESVAEIREDATLPDELRDVSARIKGDQREVFLYWNTTGNVSTDSLEISGDEEFVKSKKDDIDRFFRNNEIRWRTLLDRDLVIFLLSAIGSAIVGIVASSLLSSANGAIIGILTFNIFFMPGLWGRNSIYPKIVLAKTEEVPRVRRVKLFSKVALSILSIIAAIITITEFIL